MTNISVIRCFEIIEFLAAKGDGASLMSVARGTGLNHATALRFLSTLSSLGYVRRDPQSQYFYLTMKFASVGAKVAESFDLRRVARPFLEELSRESGETCHMGIREDISAVYIEKIESDSAISMKSGVGKRVPLHSTSIGKTLLAFCDSATRTSLLDRMQLDAFTDQTISTFDELTDHLALVRRQGYAIDNEENEAGVRCVAVPIFGANGEALASMSLSGWTVSMTIIRARTLAANLQESAERIKLAAGFSSS